MELNKHQLSVIHGTQQNNSSSKPPTLFFQLMERLECFLGEVSGSFSPLRLWVQDILRLCRTTAVVVQNGEHRAIMEEENV